MDIDGNNCVGTFDCLHIPMGRFNEPAPGTQHKSASDASVISYVFLFIHIIFLVMVSGRVASKVAKRYDTRDILFRNISKGCNL